VSVEDWFYDDLVYFYNKGVIQGYSDGTFRPNEVITWKDFLSLLVYKYNIGEYQLIRDYMRIKVDDPINTVLLHSFPAETIYSDFKTEDEIKTWWDDLYSIPITRGNAARLMYNFIYLLWTKEYTMETYTNLENNNDNFISYYNPLFEVELNIPDWAVIPSYSADELIYFGAKMQDIPISYLDIYTMCGMGIFSINQDDTFGALSNITRGEAVALLSRLFNIERRLNVQELGKKPILKESVTAGVYDSNILEPYKEIMVDHSNKHFSQITNIDLSPNIAMGQNVLLISRLLSANKIAYSRIKDKINFNKTYELKDKRTFAELPTVDINKLTSFPMNNEKVPEGGYDLSLLEPYKDKVIEYSNERYTQSAYDMTNMFRLYFNRDYRNIVSQAQLYKDNMWYYRQTKPTIYKYGNQDINSTEFFNKWIDDTIKNEVIVQAEFYTDTYFSDKLDWFTYYEKDQLSKLIGQIPTDYCNATIAPTVRGILRIKYDKHNNPDNIKNELFSMWYENPLDRYAYKDIDPYVQDAYDRLEHLWYKEKYLSMDDINIEVGKWYELGIDVGCRFMAYPYRDYDKYLVGKVKYSPGDVGILYLKEIE
jgi:hypothetical protein